MDIALGFLVWLAVETCQKGSDQDTDITLQGARIDIFPIGLQFGSLMGAAVVVEKLFAWPGVGSLLVDSVFQRDIPTVQGCILLIVTFFLLINMLIDLAYVAIDPRIRYG